MRNILAAILAFGVAACATADAQQQAQTPPCSAPEFRQMDFWLGTWDVRWDAIGNVPAGQGTNVIMPMLGDCVIREAFDGGASVGGLVGHSVSVYHAPARMWRQTWVDNQGGYFALTGGPDGEGRFILTNTRISDNAPHLRMVFEDIAENSLIWRWQRSADGQAWSDAWVIHYVRRGS